MGQFCLGFSGPGDNEGLLWHLSEHPFLLLGFSACKCWWEKTERPCWGQCPGGQGRGLSRTDETSLSFQTSLLSSVNLQTTSVCTRCQRSLMGALPGGLCKAVWVTGSLSEPHTAPARLKPVSEMHGGLNVLLIKLKARRSGSVGKRRDWELNALNLAPSLHWPSCRQPPVPPSFTSSIQAQERDAETSHNCSEDLTG